MIFQHYEEIGIYDKYEILDDLKCSRCDFENVFGAINGGSLTGYAIIKRFPDKEETKWYHRLNILWVWPLFAITIAPFNWVTKGRTGVDENGKLGKVIKKLIGEYF